MLLESIINGSNAPRIIIVEETSEVRANVILFNFLKNNAISKGSDCIHIVSFHNEPCYLEGQMTSNIILHDSYSDPLGWNSGTSKKSLNVKSINVHTHFIDHIKQTSKEHNKTSEVNIAVIFDGLSLLLRHKGIHDVCSMLNSLANLKNKVKMMQIIATIQQDVVSQAEIHALRYIADAVIVLQPNQNKPSRITRGPKTEKSRFQADVTLKKKSGKVVREVVVCNVSKDLKIEKQSDVQLSKNNEEAQEADPTKNLSFNLRLTESEKEARSQVKLPYMLDQGQKAKHLDRSNESGKIIYQPDDADDFDEEDPDEDLDI